MTSTSSSSAGARRAALPLAWACLAALTLGVAGSIVPVIAAAGGRAPSPVDDRERLEIRERLLDSAWDSVLSSTPIARRPVVDVGATVDDSQAGALITECLEEAGFAANSAGSLAPGQTRVSFAVARYSCTTRHPTLSQVTSGLSDDQRGALWDHYAMRVRPCLAGLGLPVSAPPERGYFVDRFGFDTWNPFDTVRAGGFPAPFVDRAELRCRSVPAWLDLTSPAP
ncbi:MAG: hypothetical protein RI885_933 [Actinomycetota bacterium]|jgi:hypothetical protein